MQTSKMNTGIRDESDHHPSKHAYYALPSSIAYPTHDLHPVVDSLIDGVLILTDQPELIYANDSARRTLRELSTNAQRDEDIPQEIGHICHSLIRSRCLFPNQYWLIESEIIVNELTTFHIRARWLQVEEIPQARLLLTIEDRHQAIQAMAIAESQKYGLTPRETEVWILHRANYTYKQIATKLFITPNTIKKHMRSIHLKQKEISKQN